MLERQWQKDMAQFRRAARDRRKMIDAGWEYVGENGGRLWELSRGSRLGSRITDAMVAKDGLGIWVRVSGAALTSHTDAPKET